MTKKRILKMLKNFNLDSLAPDERARYNDFYLFTFRNKQNALLKIIQDNNYSSENITVISDLINEYKIEM